MKNLVRIFALSMAFASFAQAEGLLKLPLLGTYYVKEGNIINMSGQTMVKNDETQFFACGGAKVTGLPNASKVDYKLVQPEKGPIPVLKSVTEICN